MLTKYTSWKFQLSDKCVEDILEDVHIDDPILVSDVRITLPANIRYVILFYKKRQVKKSITESKTSRKKYEIWF